MTDLQTAPTMTADMFDFDVMKEVAGDPFKEEKGAFAKDERFYVLGKDADGNGGAIVRFLPDSERAMIQRMYKVNANVWKDGVKRFVSEFSPQTIGLPDPFQDKWQDMYNAGQKEEAKAFGRGVTFITNIKIIKDPAKPENEGKIFMYQMSGAVKDKIQKAMTPSDQDVALGALPKQMFNPLKGHNFKLSCAKGENDQINYNSSEIKPEVTSIYDSVEEAIADIKDNTYTLSGLLAPDQFLSFDELTKKLLWVQFSEQTQTPKVNTLAASVGQNEPTVKTEQVKTEQVKTEQVKTEPESQNIDDILNAL